MEKIKKYMIWYMLILICSIYLGGTVQARGREDIGKFVGEYLKNTESVEEYGNPEMLELSFNGEGQLTAYRGMYYSTTGTSVYYDYSDYKISGNILTCKYEEAYSVYGIREDIAPGSHQFALTEEGNLIEGDIIWYRYVDESLSDDAAYPQTLMEVTDVDFPYGSYNDNAGFLGNKKLQRKDIEVITFQNTLENEPDSSWDVSYEQDGTVKAWADYSEGFCHVTIAADGMINAPYKSNDLFRFCTYLKKIEFNGVFDTATVRYMDYMLADCKKLKEIIGIETFDTSNVYSFKGMFAKDKRLESLDLRNFDTSRAHYMNKIFYKCSGLQELYLNFYFQTDADYADIYTGTKWEGSSPQFEAERDYNVNIRYILNFGEVEFENRKIRARVINSYDDTIDTLKNDMGYADDDAISYQLLDITNDKIPELFILINASDTNILRIYTFDIVINQVKELPGSYIWTDSDVIEYSEKDHSFVYYKDGIYTVMKWEDGKIKEMYTRNFISDPSESYRTKTFNCISPVLIWGSYFDLDNDEEDELVQVYASMEAGFDYGSSNYILISADEDIVYTMKLDEPFTKYSIQAYTFSDEKPLMNISLNGSNSKYCGILRCSNGAFTELVNLETLIDDTQLAQTDGVDKIYLDFDKRWGNTLPIKFGLYTATFGYLEFSMDYRYLDGELEQKEFLCEPTGGKECYTLAKDKEAYDTVGSNHSKFTIKAGSEIAISKLWLSNGMMWFYIVDEYGNWGWLPASPDNAFLEITHSYGTVERNAEENRNNKSYFTAVEIPDDDVLYSNAEEAYDKEDYISAYLYYSLIRKTNERYFDAKKKCDSVMKKIADDSFVEIQEYCNAEEYETAYENLILSKEFIGQDSRYQEYMELCLKEIESMKKDSTSNIVQIEPGVLETRKNELFSKLAYDYRYYEEVQNCTMDLDLDGIEEVIVRYVGLDCYEGETYEFKRETYEYQIYWYDEEEDCYKNLEENKIVTGKWEAVHFWQEKGYLAINCSFGMTNYEICYWEDGRLCYKNTTTSDLSYLPYLDFSEEIASMSAALREQEQQDDDPELSLDEKIENIREWYYSTEGDIESMDVRYDESGLEISYYKGLELKKICSMPGRYEESECPGASEYIAEYYYHNGKMYFAFIHMYDEEYRYYFSKMSGKTQCIRYIGPDMVAYDYADGIDLLELDSPTGKLCAKGMDYMN